MNVKKTTVYHMLTATNEKPQKS